MRDNVFLDTNIILYSLSDDLPFKFEISRKLMKQPFIISPQVIFEYLNVCNKKLKYPKSKSIENAEELLQISTLADENREVVSLALKLFSKYSLQIFDSKIVASALLSDCKILYSEDMQHGLVIDKKLRIVNPFI